MDDSILVTVKRSLGIFPESTEFDPDIISCINAVFLTLRQLAVGPEKGFMVTGADETWADFLGDRWDLIAVQTYTYLKVRLAFDPPSTSFVIDSIKNQISELEYRLNLEAEGGGSSG